MGREDEPPSGWAPPLGKVIGIGMSGEDI